MKAVIQRVLRAAVTIDGAQTRRIGPGLMILLGVSDTTRRPCAASWPKSARACAFLRTRRAR